MTIRFCCVCDVLEVPLNQGPHTFIRESFFSALNHVVGAAFLPRGESEGFGLGVEIPTSIANTEYQVFVHFGYQVFVQEGRESQRGTYPDLQSKCRLRFKCPFSLGKARRTSIMSNRCACGARSPISSLQIAQRHSFCRWRRWLARFGPPLGRFRRER